MAINDGPIWGIRAGATGDAETLFLKNNVVALGWGAIGDLSGLAANRDAFKATVAEHYPGRSAGAIRTDGGQLYRFVHELQIGDIVLYPSKQTRTIHCGEVTGAYIYSPQIEPGYPHHRAVKWLATLPRTSFSQGALYEIGAAMSFFSIRNHADDIRAKYQAAISGVPHGQNDLSDSSPDGAVIEPDDVTPGLTAEAIEELTRDFILQKLGTELKGHPFAGFVAHLLETMGYRTRVSPPGPDGGIDIVAHRDELGFEPPLIKVQVKSNEGSIGDPVLSSLYGKVATGEFGLMVTLGTFTAKAQAFADSKSNLRLIDGNELVRLILAHYEQFDGSYKGLLSLKSVYVPEIIEHSTN